MNFIFQAVYFFVFCFSALYAEQLSFEKVTKENGYYPLVERVFRSTIQPLYGDQSKSLQKIADAQDRVCEVLIDEQKHPLGILVYKKDPVQEFQPLGIQDALEIKTLFVIDAQQNSGRGLGSALINRVLAVAKKTAFQNIVVTVSEEKPESLAFFQKKRLFDYPYACGQI